MGFNVGAFAGGLAGGLDQGQRFRMRRQMEKLGDIELSKAKTDDKLRRDRLKRLGIESEDSFPDPYWYRWMDKIGGGRRRRSGIPSGAIDESGAFGGASRQYDGRLPSELGSESGATSYGTGEDYGDGVTMQEDDQSPYMLADGGSPAEKEREAQRLRAEQAKEDLLAIPTGIRRVGAGALNLAADVADYGADSPSVFAGPVTKGLNAARSVGAGLIRRTADAVSPDAPAAAPAAAPARTALPMEPLEEVRTRATRSPPPAPERTALPAAPAAAPQPSRRGLIPPAPEESVDFSKVDWREVPDFKVDDWKQYRKDMMASLINRGASEMEAMDAVDQKVTAMQQRKFLQFGKEALLRQQAGDLNGAMAAYRTAFQYLPSGTDVEFGVYNGNLIARGVDEKTKKAGGQGMILTPERGAAILENFQKPEAWRYWTKDRLDEKRDLRNERRTDQSYDEVTKRLAQAEVDERGMRGEAALWTAENKAAGGGGADYGTKPSDNIALSKRSAELAEGIVLQYPDADPQLMAELISGYFLKYRGKVSLDAVAGAVRRAAANPQELERLRKELGE